MSRKRKKKEEEEEEEELKTFQTILICRITLSEKENEKNIHQYFN